MPHIPSRSSFFFFNDTATTEIYTLSLHDALPICAIHFRPNRFELAHILLATIIGEVPGFQTRELDERSADRKSTRLNSSHGYISYAVFCLKKKKKQSTTT